VETVQDPLRYPGVFEHYGVNPSAALLLYGPPGTGKTLVAKALAHECQASFLHVKGPELLKSHFGESEKAVRDLFACARRNSPCCVFLDEFDALSRARGTGGAGNSGATDRIVTQLLTEMDHTSSLAPDAASGNDDTKIQVMVIAATNRPDSIDAALLRPGRFDKLVYVGMPSKADRFSILKAGIRHTPVEAGISQNDFAYLRELAMRSSGFSGADLAGVCNGARRFAIRRHVAQQAEAAALNGGVNDDDDDAAASSTTMQPLRVADFEVALESSSPSVSMAQLAYFAEFNRKRNASTQATKQKNAAAAAAATLSATATESKSSTADASGDADDKSVMLNTARQILSTASKQANK
jgi:transitional endoplasmic reticulum ATPase